MNDLVISPRNASELNSKLTQIQELSTASYLVLSHLSGTQIIEAGSLASADGSAFSALGAAAWASSLSMAQLIQESGCRSLNLIGDQKVVHVVPVGEKALLIFVFNSEVLPKGFRHLAWQWAKECALLLGSIGTSSRVSE